MLYLGAAATQYDDMYVYGDFSDPLQFYYLPANPHVSTLPDGSPAIRLLVYKEDLDALDEGDEEAVAFLSCDVDLSFPGERVEEVRRQLRMDHQLDQLPRLSPIFFREGTARFMLLDAQTPEAGEEDQPTEFVMKILGAASPSLFGDNRAIFQAMLPKKGAAALMGAMEGMTPIGVVYGLTFAGLQPAFNVRATIEWHKVYDHFSEREQAQSLFYDKDIQKVIDTLVDERVITVESTIEGVADEAMTEDYNNVMEQVRLMVFDKFFAATLDRETAARDGVADNIADGLGSFVRQTVGGLFYRETYARKEVKVDELRTETIDWTARKAALRTIYPQAHISGLIDGAGVDLDSITTVVSGDAVDWSTVPFDLSAAAAWELDGIHSVTVDLEYGQAGTATHKEWSVQLTKDSPRDTRKRWLDEVSGDHVRYSYEVVFSDHAVPGPAPKVRSEVVEHDGSVLVIHPRELYELVQLEAGAVGNFPFARVPSVQVFFRHISEDGSFEHHDDGVLTASSPTFGSRFRAWRASPARTEVKVRYFTADGTHLDADWTPMEGNHLLIGNPFPQLNVRAVVAGDRKNIANLLVDFEYEDTDNGLRLSHSMSFDEDNLSKPQAWAADIVDKDKRRYRYAITLIAKDGEMLSTGWIESEAPTIPVGEVYVKQMGVELSVGELGPEVESIDVELSYDDELNDVHATGSVHLAQSDSSGRWEVKLLDPGRRAYTWTARYRMKNGFDHTVGPVTSTEAYLRLASSPPGD